LLLRIWKKSLCIITDGRHGSLGKDSFFLRHLLIKLPYGNICPFSQIILSVKRNIERDNGNPGLCGIAVRQITGTVADYMKLHTLFLSSLSVSLPGSRAHIRIAFPGSSIPPGCD